MNDQQDDKGNSGLKSFEETMKWVLVLGVIMVCLALGFTVYFLYPAFSVV